MAAQTKSQLPSFFSLLNDTFKVYGQKLKSLLIISLCYYILMIATVAIFILVRMIDSLIVTATNNLIAALIVNAIAILVIAVSILILFSWISAATIIVLKDRQETFGLREALKRAKPYAMPSLWVGILSAPILFLGYIFFIIPGIIFSIWFLFSRYLVITDNKKGMEALLKSRDYGRGNFWNIFLLAALGIVSMLFIDSIIQSLEKAAGPQAGNVIDFIFGFLISPASTIYYYLIFENLKKTKGDLPVSATPTGKKIFGSMAILGFILMAALAALWIYFAPQIKKIYEEEARKLPAAIESNIPVLPQNAL
jgi:hypothetical protein